MPNSTAELITGLVQLVPLTNTTQLSQEAMEVRPSLTMKPAAACDIFAATHYMFTVHTWLTPGKTLNHERMTRIRKLLFANVFYLFPCLRIKCIYHRCCCCYKLYFFSSSWSVAFIVPLHLSSVTLFLGFISSASARDHRAVEP